MSNTDKLIDDHKNKYGGHWGEDPRFPLEVWQAEVASGGTRMGYWRWAFLSRQTLTER